MTVSSLQDVGLSQPALKISRVPSLRRRPGSKGVQGNEDGPNGTPPGGHKALTQWEACWKYSPLFRSLRIRTVFLSDVSWMMEFDFTHVFLDIEHINTNVSEVSVTGQILLTLRVQPSTTTKS